MKARWIGLIILLILVGLIKSLNAKPINLFDTQEAIFLYIYEDSSQELLDIFPNKTLMWHSIKG
jgi:hypothetical protein